MKTKYIFLIIYRSVTQRDGRHTSHLFASSQDLSLEAGQFRSAERLSSWGFSGLRWPRERKRKIYIYTCLLKFRFVDFPGAQWIRICLPTQGTQVWSLIWEDLTCYRTKQPMHHNFWASALRPISHGYLTCEMQLLKAVSLGTAC